MKNNYYDNDGADVKRAQRKKKKKERKALKGFLIFLSVIIVALAVFVTTVKVLAPDFDFTTLLPQTVQTFVDERIFGNTTTTAPTTTAPTTTEKPTAKMMNYIEFDEFELKTSKQGNLIGNLLNGGKVATDSSYIYHIAGDGLYRLNPDTEGYTRLYKSSHTLSSLNLRGDFIYFIDDEEQKLYKMQKGAKDPKSVRDNVKFALVYDSTVYFISVDNDLCVMDAKALEPKTLYSSADDEMRLVGISKHRVYFAVKGYDGSVDYFTLATDGSEDVPSPFRERETTDSKLVMENGFLYYYRENGGKYEIVRQKFGSEKTVTLAKDGDGTNYIEVENNRLYYTELDGKKLYMTEINMNSKKSRYLMAVKDAGSAHNLRIFHGGEYDFVIGEKENGKKIYRAGCVFTGSTNYMKFSDGRWKY